MEPALPAGSINPVVSTPNANLLARKLKPAA
jgi:hypothetical protein